MQGSSILVEEINSEEQKCAISRLEKVRWRKMRQGKWLWQANRGAVTRWAWVEKALCNNLQKAGLTDKTVSDHRPDRGENEPESRNSSVSEDQTMPPPWMSVLVKNFSPVCCHLSISSQVVSAHKWIRLNRLTIFTSFSFSNMPLCPSVHTPKNLY